MPGLVARRIRLPGEPLCDGPTAVRPWRDSDREAIVRACQDPELVRWVPIPVPYGESDARAFLISRYDAAFAGAMAPFAIVEHDDGRLVGSISLLRFRWRHARAEIGYWLAAPARGHGHATRAVRLVCGWAFATLALARIELLAAVDNQPSQRVAERAGFTREVVRRDLLRGRDGTPEDYVCFGLLAGEL